MIKKTVLLHLLFLVTFIARGQEAPSQDEWNQYFNAIFLPEGSAESQKALEALSNRQLEEMANPSANGEPKRKDHSPKLNRQVLSAEDAVVPASEDVVKKGVIAPVMLPNDIESAEKVGNSGHLKSLYSRYNAEYPLHANVYLYGRDALRAISSGGWLVVNGHLDTYPVRALQEIEKLRTDVTVVNLGWLREDAAYRTVIAARLPQNPNWKSSDSEVELIQKLQNTIPGMVHLSLTLPPSLLKAFSNQVSPVGTVLLLGANGSTAERHHALLEAVNWDEVASEGLPTYVKALQQNYLAALLMDAKLGQPEKLAGYNRAEIMESLYEQRNMKSAASKYLKSE